MIDALIELLNDQRYFNSQTSEVWDQTSRKMVSALQLIGEILLRRPQKPQAAIPVLQQLSIRTFSTNSGLGPKTTEQLISAIQKAGKDAK